MVPNEKGLTNIQKERYGWEKDEGGYSSHYNVPVSSLGMYDAAVGDKVISGRERGSGDDANVNLPTRSPF